MKDYSKPQPRIYLPNEGLQGEDIPSHILWKDTKVEYVQVFSRLPLKFKEIFNAKSWKMHETEIVVKKVEVDGYIGLSFESSKVSALEIVVPIEYLIHLQDGYVIKETKEIKLFRPQLKIDEPEKDIRIDRKGFVRGQIGFRNIGRGTLLIYVSTTEDSPTELETPPENREFAEKFLSDLLEEMSKLAEKFPQFHPFVDEIHRWEEKDEFARIGISDQERDEFVEYVERLGNVLASDRDLVQGFVNAYGKALAKNSELIEAVRRIVKLYESLVSKDILLINPFDEIVVKGEKTEINLKISQTDKLFDPYEDKILPKIELRSSEEARIPIHKLFRWR